MTLHVLPARDLEDVQRRKRHVLVVEERLVRAFGSAADAAALAGDPSEEVRTP